jgi:Protein of unknown function DUF2625
MLGISLIVNSNGQVKMKSLNELINKEADTWGMIKQWIKEAKNPVQILPKDSAAADSVLYQAQVTTRSPMGAIVYETGGILVDSGWIRILGSGSPQINRSLMSWNKGKSFLQIGQQPSFLLVADDVLGGYYAINAGGLSKTGIGKVFYFAPDNIKWSNLQMSYSDFLLFCFSGNLNKYYKGFRWTDWKKDVTTLNGNTGFSFFPFLWSKEGQKDINQNSRKIAPIQELWELYFAEPKKSKTY